MVDGVPLLQRIAAAKIAWSGERFGVLARNLANADTPDYRPKDIAKPDFGNLLAQANTASGTRLQVTHRDHIAPDMQQTLSFRARESGSREIGPNGNGVVIAEQMQKLGETQLDYRMATNIYGKFKGFLKTAMGNGGV